MTTVLRVPAIVLATAIVSAYGLCFNIQFLCKSGQCLNGKNERACDGITNCAGGDDESRCGKGNCTLFEFECDNGICVHGYEVCDGYNNCGDNSDENSCGPTNFQSFIVGIVVGSTVFSVGLPCCCVICAGIGAFIGYRHLKRRKGTIAAVTTNSGATLDGESEKGLLLEQVTTKEQQQPLDEHV